MVLVDTNVYINHLENIPKNNNKFEKFDVKTRTLHFQINHEKQYKKIKAVGSKPGLLYDICKAHKIIVHVCSPFRPILSAIKTIT